MLIGEKGEARWHDWVAAPWTRFGHTCCSGAPRPRRTCAAVCTCRARRRIKWSARRRPGASSRSSRTFTRTTTIDLRPGTSIPPTASSCGGGRSRPSAAGGVARWLGAASRALGSSTESAAECAACGCAQGLTDCSLSPRESPALRRGGRLKRRVSPSSPTQPEGEESYAVGLMDGTDGRSYDRASPPRRDFRSSTKRPSYECPIPDELVRSGHVERYRHRVRDLHQHRHSRRLHCGSILCRRRATRDERIRRCCTSYGRGDVGGNDPGMPLSPLQP